ncbi:DUF418 domain-containing protein [Ideonella sp.]|uniref:DUF418 domain-containing protein n=1 Tax=Ideonella sp. TaxID=1929293 RepID=UPI002B47616C|nr:DUF418 domain-containing protein [Ideonella sp.]HJV68762.1 DUF418 domain-containing protein [Ideonella sp.]
MSRRIDIVDALRGSALFGILLLHSVEHWDFLHLPEHQPPWLARLDQLSIELGYLLFGGKAYAIFALLFGVSFFITLDNWNARSRNASGRFLWRLAVLGVLGYLHGLLYCGDILTVIAALGVPLVLLNRLGGRALAAVAVALLLQPPQWPQVLHVLADPSYTPAQPEHWRLYALTDPVFANGSFGDVLRLNAWTGQAAKWWWVIETYRYPQMLGLFVCGLLLGRSGAIQDPPRLRRFALRALLIGAAGIGVMLLVRFQVDALGLQGTRQVVVGGLVNAYASLAQTAVWAGGFVLLYQWAAMGTWLRVLVPYGRMSLTCYVTQAVVGVPFFYGFGLGMYRQVGPFYALFFALAVFALQCALAHAWLKRYSYGPLEWVWRAATLRSLQVPMRRRAGEGKAPAQAGASAS